MPDVVFLYDPFVRNLLDDGETDAVREGTPWRRATSELDVAAGDLVIARHYAWPWPERLDRTLARLGARALNAAKAYRYAADPRAWAADLGPDLTPATWDRFEQLPADMAFIVKGEHADKGRWDRMYAADRSAAIQLRSELWRDSGVRAQTVVARQYVPLVELGDGFGGCPPAAEVRVQVLDGVVVGGGAYWPREDCTRGAPPTLADVPRALLDAATTRLPPYLRWYTLDVAQTRAGPWIVIEVSDGQRAGFGEGDPAEIYAAMAAQLAARE